MKKIKIFIGTATLTGLMVFLFATLSSATLITQTRDLTNTRPSFKETFTFNRYAEGNTLESVEVIFSMAIDNGWLGVDNDGTENAAVTVELGAKGEITSIDVPLFSTSSYPFTAVVDALEISRGETFDLAPNQDDAENDLNFEGPDGAIYTGSFALDSDQGLIHSDYFGNYTGNDTFDILVDVESIINFGGIGGVEGGFRAVTVDGLVTINYIDSDPGPDPDPIPEPATLLLFGSGLIALLGVGRSRIGTQK